MDVIQAIQEIEDRFAEMEVDEADRKSTRLNSSHVD